MIPLPTTTITIYRKPNLGLIDPDAAGFDGPYPDAVPVAVGLNACISAPSMVDRNGEEIETWQLRVDPCDLRQWDYVLDEVTGKYFEVDTSVTSTPTLFDLQHVHATIRCTSGVPDEIPKL